MPDPTEYESFLDELGGDPSQLDVVAKYRPDIAERPKFKALVAGVAAAHQGRQDRKVQSALVRNQHQSFADATNRPMFQTPDMDVPWTQKPSQFAVGAADSGGREGVLGLINAADTVQASARERIPLPESNLSERDIQMAQVRYGSRIEAIRGLLRENHTTRVSNGEEFNERNRSDLADRMRVRRDDAGVPSPALQMTSPLAQKLQGVTGTLAGFVANAPSAIIANAGTSAEAAINSGATVGDSLSVAMQQAALDKIGVHFVGANARNAIQGSVGSLPANVGIGAAMGAGYGDVASGITAQYDTAAAEQEQSLENRAFNAGLGGLMMGGPTLVGNRIRAHNERVAVEAKRVEADALADAQQAAEVKAAADHAANMDVLAEKRDQQALQIKGDRRVVREDARIRDNEVAPELAKVEGARRIEEHYRNREAEGDLIAEQYAKTNGLNVADFVASDRARRANSRMLGDAPVAIDPNATTQSKPVSSMIRGIRERSQPKVEEAVQPQVEPVQRAPELPGEMSPHSKIQTEQQANRLRNERLRVRDEKRDRIQNEAAARKEQFNRDQIAERELSQEAERNLAAKEQLDAEAARNAEVERDAIAQREPQSASPQMIKPGMKRPALSKVGERTTDSGEFVHSKAMKKQGLDQVFLGDNTVESKQQTGAGFKQSNARKGSAVNPAEVVEGAVKKAGEVVEGAVKKAGEVVEGAVKKAGRPNWSTKEAAAGLVSDQLETSGGGRTSPSVMVRADDFLGVNPKRSDQPSGWLRNHIESGGEVAPLLLNLSDHPNGELGHYVVTGHEGRGRAMVSKSNGHPDVPVMLRFSEDRNRDNINGREITIHPDYRVKGGKPFKVEIPPFTDALVKNSNARKGSAVNPAEVVEGAVKAVGKGVYKVGKWISEQGIPDPIHRANMDREGDLSARKYSLENADGRFLREMRKSKLTPSEVLESLQDRTILKGSNITKEMRDLTDGMSREAKTLGLVDPETGKIFDEREGTYTNDSFKAHDPVAGPIWEKKVPAEVRTAYANELRARGFNSKEITSIIDDALQGYKSDRSQFASVEIDTANGTKHGNLKAKQPMTDARRALLGPETDPRLVAARTVAKLNKMITDRAYAKRLLNEGHNEVFFDKPSKDSTGNYNNPVQFPSFSEADTGKTYYTTKAIKDYLVDRGPNSFVGGLLAMDGYTRAAKTVGAGPGFAVTQIPQNIMSTLANGHIPGMPGTTNAIKGVVNYMRHDWHQRRGTLTKELEDEHRELIRRNVIRPHESSARLIDSISKDTHNPGYSVRSPLDAAKWGWKHSRRLASMVDEMMKVNADAMQQAWIKQMDPSKTDTQIKRQSTLDIGQTYYTPSEKFAGATKLGKIPLATSFITPFAELIRNPSRIVGNNYRDFVNGGKTTKAIVLAKTGALLAVAGGPAVLSALSEEMLEPNPKIDKAEEIAAFRKAHSKYNEFDDLWLSRDEKGNIQAYNISKYNMFALPWKMARIMRKEGVTTLEGIKKLGEAVGSPIFSPAAKAVGNVAKSYGEPTRDGWDRAKIIADAFLPTLLGTSYDAMNESDKDKTQKAFMSGMLGVNTMLTDPKKELRLNTLDANAKRKVESSAVAREVKTPGDALAAVMGSRRVNGEEAVDAEQAEQLADIQDTASTEKAEAVEQARASGLPEEEIIRVLKNTGESPTEVGKLILTKEQLADPVAIRIKSMLSKMDDQYGPELAVVEQITEMPKGMDKAQLYNENKDAFKKGLPRYTTYKIASKILRGAGKLPPGPYRDKLMNDALKRLEKEMTPPAE